MPIYKNTKQKNDREAKKLIIILASHAADENWSSGGLGWHPTPSVWPSDTLRKTENERLRSSVSDRSMCLHLFRGELIRQSSSPGWTPWPWPHRLPARPVGPHPLPIHGSLRTVVLYFTHLFAKIFKPYFVENEGSRSGKGTF